MDIKQGEILNNEELCDIFKCSPQGGMRRSHSTNTLIIVSNNIKSIYADRWEGEILHYTGMGSSGNQSLSFGQNKTLNESKTNRIPVYLFEVFKTKEYVYQGEIELVDNPYQEIQNNRNVWMFPLKIKNGAPLTLDQKQFEQLKKNERTKTKKLNINQIKILAEERLNKQPSRRKVESTTYIRDQRVVEYALLRANGKCQLCEQDAPFLRKDGTPYLEVHHIDYMANGGIDTIDNVAALCPNCHRKMHALENEIEYKKLKKLAKQKTQYF